MVNPAPAASSILLAHECWEDLWRALGTTSSGTKGAVFELLVQEYLQLDAKYDFKNVWNTHGQIPPAVLKNLNLFNRDVTGIDLVAETRGGKFWAIQCKYHQDEHASLTREEATGLIAGRNRARDLFEVGLICTTVNGRSANLKGEPDLEYLMGDVWRGLEPEFFARLRARMEGRAEPPVGKKEPRPHQREALDSITTYFASHSRGKVVMPCATGKSLVGFWAAQKLGAYRVLVAVPNLSLVRQLLKDWTEQSLAHGRRPRWAVVCSDNSVADSAAARDLGVKVDTDVTEVTNWLRSCDPNELSVIFTTYQSGRVAAEAARAAGVAFDVGIFDEAHRTAGREGAPFAHLLSDENVPVDKRIYMTATPRVFKGKDREDIISMDDSASYGADAFKMTFLSAMDRGIIPNLTIVAVTVSEHEVEKLLRDRLFVRLRAEFEDEVIRTEDLVSALALRKAMKKFGIHRTLGFYSSRKRCHLAGRVQEIIGKLLPTFGELDVRHVDGEMTAAERDAEMRAFEQSESAFMTNVRVFVEGVDCPSMDAVMFADPRQSVIDIVQGVGRALRPFEGKTAGYAIIPTVIADDGTPSDPAYEQVVRVACALGSENEVIRDYFAAIAQGGAWTGRRVFEVLGDVEVGVRLDLEKFDRALAVSVHERTVEWRPFLEARDFARRLRLGSAAEWDAYVHSGNKPLDIPATPRKVYEGRGWESLDDWLGHGVIASHRRQFREFEEARKFARNLGFPGSKEWWAFAKTARRPLDIPQSPHRTYKDAGWKSYGDWLGTDVVASAKRNYLPFEEARDFARKLRLRSGEDWKKFARSGALPENIPSNPWRTYGASGWVDIGDWLDTGRVSNFQKNFRPFKDARRFARSLGLKTQKEWMKFARSSKRPADIPNSPASAYADKGWVNVADWLGTSNLSARYRAFQPFEEARRFVRSLGLKSGGDWKRYARSAKRPVDIPANPWDSYGAEQGWKDIADWLGTKKRLRVRTSRGFLEARSFARSLNLRTGDDWVEWATTSARPSDIPSNPGVVYKGKGWQGMRDFLGTENLPFEEARAFARSLGLNSSPEWVAYAKSDKRPPNIPANPIYAYQGRGWAGIADWLGYVGYAPRKRRKKTSRRGPDGGVRGRFEPVRYRKSPLRPLHRLINLRRNGETKA